MTFEQFEKHFAIDNFQQNIAKNKMALRDTHGTDIEDKNRIMMLSFKAQDNANNWNRYLSGEYLGVGSKILFKFHFA